MFYLTSLDSKDDVQKWSAVGRDINMGQSQLLSFSLWDETVLSVQTNRGKQVPNPFCGKETLAGLSACMISYKNLSDNVHDVMQMFGLVFFNQLTFWYSAIHPCKSCLKASIERLFRCQSKTFHLVCTWWHDKGSVLRKPHNTRAVLFKLVWCHASSYLFSRTKWSAQFSTCLKMHVKCVFASR